MLQENQERLERSVAALDKIEEQKAIAMQLRNGTIAKDRVEIDCERSIIAPIITRGNQTWYLP